MGGPQTHILAPNPELTPSPFPDWSRPGKFMPLNINTYWVLRIQKERLPFTKTHIRSIDIQNMAKCAVRESKNGMWKIASHTFEEAILQVQKLEQSNSLSSQECDSLWIDVSIGLREAGFYEQARHVLRHIKNESIVHTEEKLLNAFIITEQNRSQVMVANTEDSALFAFTPPFLPCYAPPLTTIDLPLYKKI
ncbi:Uncharacterised protein [uncultured archaeon]|nr:Uncharacterised protein [uncultured archaeon]